MTQLLLAAAGGWILDLAFFLVLILGTVLGAYRGFVAGICKLAGKIASLIFAVVFCISFANFLETCFHMTSAIAEGIAGSLAKNEVYAQAIGENITGAELGSRLGDMQINGLVAWLIQRSFATVAQIPAGTTPAMLFGSILAKWISVGIAFVLLLLLVRLGAWVVSRLFRAINSKIAPLRVVDQCLGALLGLAKALFWLFVVFSICNWLPFEGLQNFIASANIVGKIYTSEWFRSATSYAISGSWFGDYIKDFIM